MTNFQFQIPQQGDQLSDALRLLIVEALLAQYQHVDIGQRMQFSAAITANGNHRRLRDIIETVECPQALQELVDVMRSRIHQFLGAQPGIKGVRQPALKLFHMLFEALTV